MSESEVIGASTDGPLVRDRLVADLAHLGVETGMTLVVHSSLRSLGWVVGGPVTVIQALLECLGATGTLVLPTHSGDLSDPAGWSNPPVDPSWWAPIREHMPAFDRDMTPTRGMGSIPECFRKAAGVLRSDHPQFSFAALGPKAELVTEGHALNSSFGEQSPLARVYDLEGSVLLLGVGHASNTSFHLAETRADFPSKRTVRHGAPLREGAETQWTEFEDLDPISDDFEQLGAAYESDRPFKRGRVGDASASLFSQRGLVDFAVGWLEAERCPGPPEE